MKRSFRWTKLDVVSVLMAAALLLTISGGVVERRASTTPTVALPRIVVDAGHGGEDGGAETADGVLEKTINLAIARPLGEFLAIMGYEVIYTRTTDTMVDAVGDTLRERKVSDMRNRLACINQADVAVLIHQNHFSQQQYSGAQVFYGVKASESRGLAEAIQTAIAGTLQPQNKRMVKQGDPSVYLLANALPPTVLVECGFLSNVQEAEQLQDAVYQREMALAVAFGILSV